MKKVSMAWSIIIPCGALIVTVVAQILLSSRHQKTESETRGREMGTIANALQGIKDDVTEIKVEQRTMADKQDARHERMLERIVATEASAKSAHKRLDAIKAPRVE